MHRAGLTVRAMVRCIFGSLGIVGRVCKSGRVASIERSVISAAPHIVLRIHAGDSFDWGNVHSKVYTREGVSVDRPVECIC